MSAHSSSDNHHTEQETHETFGIDKIAAWVCWILAALLIFFWFRFQAFDSIPNTSASSTSSRSFIDQVDAWWKKQTGPKELGGVTIGKSNPTPTTSVQPANPVPTTNAFTEKQDYLVKTDVQTDMVPIPATTKEYPNGYWLSGSGEYRIGYWNTRGEWKTLHSHNYENGEIIYFPSDRDWSKPIYAACEKGFQNVTVTVHPPD